MTPEEVQRAEVEISFSIDQAKQFIEKREILKRLETNEDFKKLIMDEYLEKEAVRLVSLLMDNEMQGEQEQDMISKELYAISSLRLFFRNIYGLAAQMESKIERSEKVLDELRTEED
jgi:hypothetical protein